MAWLITAAVLILFAVSASAQVPPSDAIETILLPVTVRDAPGAFGTRWRTELWAMVEPQFGFVAPLFGDSACDPPCPLPGGPAPGSFLIGFFRTHAGEAPGSLMYAAKDTSAKVHLTILLRETAVSPTSVLPVQIPVIRSHEAIIGVIQIMNLPVSADQRQMLRIYSFDPNTFPDVRVRAYSDPDNRLYYEGSIRLTASRLVYNYEGNDGTVTPFQVRPPAGEMVVPQPPASLGADRIRLEITPATVGLPCWAFVTITDNVTQTVTLRSPG